MKHIGIIIIFLPLLLAGCGKEQTDISDVFGPLNIPENTVSADGQSTVKVSVKLSDKTSTDRKSVIFSTSAGVFTVSGTKEQNVIAEFENGEIIARATLRAPFSPGEITVSVKPAFDSPVKEFTVSGVITAVASDPESIKLEPSASGIGSNFINEIWLNGFVKNKDNKNVSSGVKVLFEDELLSGAPAGGSFRDVTTTTGDSSKVSAWFGAPLLPIGTRIKLRATVLDTNGSKTNIADSVFITINL